NVAPATGVSVVTAMSGTLSVPMPDCTVPVSAHVKVMVESTRFQPAELGDGVSAGVSTGLVLSIFTVTEAGASALLPATSWHGPVDVLVVPVVWTVNVPPPVTTLFTGPDPGAGSVQANVTVVLALFQPAALLAGVFVPTITGGVVSMP